MKKSYVLVGTGGRGINMFAEPLLSDFPDSAELIGLFDHNSLRIKAANELLKTNLPAYTDFDKMLSFLGKRDSGGRVQYNFDSLIWR